MVFTDNVGIIIAGLFRPRGSGIEETPDTLRDVNGTLFGVRTYGGNSSANFNVSAVTFTAQVGKGNTPATRQDIDIENPFSNGGVEDNQVGSLSGIYNVAQARIIMSTAIGATIGAGAITEVCKFITVNDRFGGDHVIMVMRDIIDPPVNFIATNTINIENRIDI